jgi:hypothetical protein
MIGAFAIAVALSFPTDARAVRIDGSGWPTPVDITKQSDALRAGERLWWWSPQCAPQRLNKPESEVQCVAPGKRTISVLDEKAKPLPGARVIWATERMLDEVPESMLPAAETTAAGEAFLACPNGEKIFVRVAGPRSATWWRTLTATTLMAQLQPAPAVEPVTELLVAGKKAAKRSTFEVWLPSVGTAAELIKSWATTSDGVARLFPLPRMPVRFFAWSDESAPATGLARTDDLPRAITLPPGVDLHARVLDAEGAPVVNAAIDAVFAIEEMPRAIGRAVRSDARGSAVVAGLPPGPLQLTVVKDGYASLLRTLTLTDATTLPDLILRRGRVVQILVTDRDRKPVGGASLLTSNGIASVTRPDGVARLEGVPADEETAVTIRATGFKTSRIVLQSDAQQTAMLSRGVRVAGTVVNATTGEPAGPGTVLVVNNGRNHLRQLDRSGVIDISGLDAGTLRLEIRARGLAPHDINERQLADEEQWDLGTLPLPEGATLSGRVVDAETQRPICSAAIRVLRRRSDGPTAAFAMGDWVEYLSLEDGSFHIGGLSPGPQIVLVEAEAYAPRVIHAPAPETEEAKADLGDVDLERARQVVIRCSPVHRCGSEARLLFPGAELSWASSSAPLENGVARIPTAAPGTGTLRLVEGDHLLHERQVNVSRDPATEINVTLASTRVVGVVSAAGRSRSGGHVELRRQQASSSTLPVFVESQTTQGQVINSKWLNEFPLSSTSAVDNSGSFRFDDLEPGDYEAAYRLDGNESRPVRVTVPEREEYRFVLDVPGGEMRGQVVDESSAPVRLARLRIRDSVGVVHSTQSQVDGTFGVTGLADGAATVEATSSAGDASADVDVRADHPATVTLVTKKKERTTITISVTDPAGRPLPGALVFVHASDSLRVGTSDSSGSVRFQLATPSTAIAAAYTPHYGWAWMPATSVEAGGEPEARLHMVEQTGTVTVNSAMGGLVEMFSDAGVPVHMVLSTAGFPTTVPAGGTLQFSGLPRGTYRVGIGPAQAAAPVQPGKETPIILR